MDPEARVIVTARDTTGSAFASADRHLKSFARGVTQLRSGLSLLGVAFSGRALAQWMSRAVEATDAVGEQREAVEKARNAFKEFSNASDRLAESFAIHLTPSVNLLAEALDGIRQIYNPTEDEKLSKDIARIETEINRLASGIIKFEEGDFWRRLAGEEVWENAREQVAELRKELAKLYEERDRRANQQPSGGFADFFGGGPADASQLAFQRKVEEERRKAQEERQRAIDQQIEDGQRLTQSMRTELEKQLDEWNKAQELFRAGAISGETLNRVRDSLLQPIEVTAERMKEAVGEMTEDATNFAQSMGENFRDAFADWIIGADRSFKDLLKRMTADMIASGIFDAFATAFSGGTSGFAKFFGSFFGGARADGGPVSAGRSYLVGERGPEIFTPRGAGMISPGGGIAIHMGDTNIDARGATIDLVQRLPKILDDHRQRTKAEIADLIRRNRFATT